MSCQQFKKEGGRGVRTRQTEQMLWNGKSDHFTSHLFCLPVYCCKAGVQRSRCLAKHEGAVPLSLWGWLSPSSHCWCIDMTAAWFHGAAKKPLVVSVNWDGTVSLSYFHCLLSASFCLDFTFRVQNLCVHVLLLYARLFASAAARTHKPTRSTNIFVQCVFP